MRAVVYAGSAVHERGVRVHGANLCTSHRALHRRRRTPAVHRRAQRSVPLRALRKRLSGHAAQVPRRRLYLIARGGSALTARRSTLAGCQGARSKMALRQDLNEVLG